MSKILKKGVDKVIDSKAVNLLMPVKKSKDRIEDVLKFKTTRKLLEMSKPKKANYVPFETLCEKNDIDEKELCKRYRITSTFALISLIALFGWLIYGVFALFKGDYIVAVRCSATLLACMGIYFYNVVDAYCYRTRQTHSKLSFINSLEHIIPNPFHDFAQVSVVEKDGEVVKKLNAFLLSKND
ncbi:hypothetical protein GZ350_004136 [Salmonella enterica]|uniref:Uncharacterized protein n=2 Tax=Salmonella enterica TaxID=28901 RepID=A0A5W5I016_SALTI|nr:hypothetical protein [Salmonella enterica]EBF6445048.1 hypothetical protein [Salmonella enterica subsp. enterica serovar Typhi]EBS6560884.1 hypothetical protein [Salmonella enterica subsp. enterica serovar Braenderup]ECH7576267.1 hypothetical protein [Salmonella enterica subsp. enterica serovar Newport]EEE9973890.1 hypothetical protein [Salmonella enterica subsp. enterica serovar Enteritidis]EHQ7308214.1 hypothetical protein [Salmonella enterica subsp. enterica]MCB3508486.1 hypothetical pr